MIYIMLCDNHIHLLGSMHEYIYTYFFGSSSLLSVTIKAQGTGIYFHRTFEGRLTSSFNHTANFRNSMVIGLNHYDWYLKLT